MLCGSQSSCGEVILQLLVYGLSNGAVLALNAIGVTVVYGTVRTLNLAHGDVFALTSVLVVSLITALGVQPDWPPALLVGALALVLGAAALTGALLNVAIERLAFKPFRGRSRLAPLIATLAISFILFQAALIWRTTLPSWVRGVHHGDGGPLDQVPRDGIPDLLPDLDLVRASGLPLDVTFRFNNLVVLVVAVAGALGVSWFLRRTATGRAIRACSQNPQLAQLCGVDPEAAIRRAFAFGGALAGAAAFVFVLYYSRPFGSHGAQSGLLAFTAAILGGIGSPMGALSSGLLLSAFGSLSDYFLAAHWTPVLLQALLIGLLLLRPTGLAAEDRAEDLASNQDRDAVMVSLLGTQRARARLSRWLAWGALALGLAFPLVFGIHSQVLAAGVGVFMLLVLGLNLQLGLAGILDLGYTVSFGIGAYLAAALTSRWVGFVTRPMDFFFVLMLCAALAGLFGLLKGRLTSRLRSDYLTVATLALGLLARQVILNLKGLTGGSGGISALPPPTLLTYPLTHPIEQYYLVFGLVALVALASQRLIRSRIGQAWLAGSEDEIAAASCGVNVGRYKMLALTLSAAVAGVAGALYASLFAYVSPELVGFQIVAMTLAMVILGGAGSVPGAILGTLILAGYDRVAIPQLGEFLEQFFPVNLAYVIPPDVRGMSYLTFGLGLYLTVLFRTRRRAELEPEAEPQRWGDKPVLDETAG